MAAARSGDALSPRRPHRSYLLRSEARAWLTGLQLPPAAREQITIALTLMDAIDAQLAPLDEQLRALAKRQPGCRALMRHYGIGPLTSITILAELGGARRFSSSREAVRYAGMDITVHQCDARRAPGHLSRQGPSALRWALFEAAQCARRPASPDHDYYVQAAARLGGNRACLGVRAHPNRTTNRAHAPPGQRLDAEDEHRSGASTRWPRASSTRSRPS